MVEPPICRVAFRFRVIFYDKAESHFLTSSISLDIYHRTSIRIYECYLCDVLFFRALFYGLFIFLMVK